MIKAVIFDFGGVLSEEGFRQGLKAIAYKNRIDPEDFFITAEELIYQTGYVTGLSDEADFWNALREKTGITGSNAELREDILRRFILKPAVIEHVKKIKAFGLITAILSDQTNWLDEINKKTPFYHHFDYVFNSFTLKKGKKDPSVFNDVCAAIGIKPDEAIFVDDNINNIRRASASGLRVIHFSNINSFEKEMGKHIPSLLSAR